MNFRKSITQKLKHYSSEEAVNPSPNMKTFNLQLYTALSASWISTLACAYVAYTITEPKPEIDINFIYEANAALVSVKSESNGTLKEVKAIHKNLDCLQDKGYIVKRLCIQPYEPMVYIENAANCYSISEDCASCGVATEIEYSSLFGRRKELLEWAPQANHELLKVKHHPTHKQQNLH